MRLDADKDYLICEYCGNIHFPDCYSDGVKLLGEQSTLTCPLCPNPLVHAAINGHRILYCSRCRGMLISMGIFPSLIEGMRAHRETDPNIPSPPDPKALDRHIRCPQCANEMDTHPYGGPGNIVIDDCERCGLNWLDYGELQRIVGAPDRRYGEFEWKTS